MGISPKLLSRPTLNDKPSKKEYVSCKPNNSPIMVGIRMMDRWVLKAQNSRSYPHECSKGEIGFRE